MFWLPHDGLSSFAGDGDGGGGGLGEGELVGGLGGSIGGLGESIGGLGDGRGDSVGLGEGVGVGLSGLIDGESEEGLVIEGGAGRKFPIQFPPHFPCK